MNIEGRPHSHRSFSVTAGGLPSLARDDRYHPESAGADQRSPFERDRDRILYCSAFRRLAGVTQVVGVSEGHRFHNRMTHTLKVAQIGRRLAQHLCTEQPELAKELGVEPEVVEAACLAHDLGHPPFGHIGERTLCRKVDDALEGSGSDGFEGNAQSFRILNSLAQRHSRYDGLNLTRATLSAVLKYPWLRSTEEGSRQSRKWGAYSSEEKELTFAMETRIGERSAEAEIMNWADDVAYSVYDLEDFYRGGIIPLGTLVRSDLQLDQFLRETTDEWWQGDGNPSEVQIEQMRNRMSTLLTDEIPRTMLEPYRGSREQRAEVRNWSSRMLGRYIRNAVELRKPDDDDSKIVKINPKAYQEVNFLKALTRHYVISNPALAAQQYGHCTMIEDLFDDLLDIVSTKDKHVAVPWKWQDVVNEEWDSGADGPGAQVRLVADMISDMTEEEAIAMHQRLRGIQAGSVFNRIIQ